MSVFLIKRQFLFFLLLIFPFAGTCQLTLTSGLSAYQIASILAGQGVQVSNAVITSPANYYSSFTATGTNLGLASGVLLTTGDNSIAVGPNNTDNAATIDNNPGDNDLESISGAPTFDAAVLEFDFVPQNDTVSFRYVFASEEYPEYVCSPYNDLFAFFISGPGFPIPKNIALIPGTTTTVAINSVNSGIPGTYADPNAPCNLSYPGFYNDNTNGTTIQYDGFTTVLTAMAVVTPCQTYHLKIAITDSSDPNYDSGVFLEAGSLSSRPIVYAGSDGSFCNGTVHAAGLSPVAGWTYTWSPTTGVSNPNIANPLITLNNSGSNVINANYVITATNGTCTLNDTLNLTIYPTPNSTFTNLPDICTGDTVTLNYTGSASAIANYSWNISGGTIVSGSGQGPIVVTYPNPGKFATSLQVNYGVCLGPVTTDSVQVIAKPIINFTLPDSVCRGTSITLQNNAVNPANCIYNWNFGSGTMVSGNGAGPYSVLWNTAGNSQVQLSISNQACSESSSQPILIKQPPVASFSIPTQICSIDTAQLLFNGTAGAASTYQWLMNSSQIISGSGTGPINIIPVSFGVDSVFLIVNDLGCSDTAINTLQIFEQPVASFGTPPAVCEGDSVTLNFTGNSPAGTGSTWWLQAGSPSGFSTTGPIQTQYNTPGKFAIVLTLDNSGCTDTYTDSILVNPMPLVQFAVSSECFGIPIPLNNQSTITSGNINSTSWNFGDNQTSIANQPGSHLYNTPGSFTITLTATSDQLCIDSVSRTVLVYDLPVSNFSTDSVCEGVATNFTNTTSINSGNIVNWTYFQNNVVISNDSDFQYLFQGNGTYIVELVTESNFNCRDTVSRNVIVHSKPEVNISALPQQGCQPLDVAFTGIVSNQDGAITNTTWLFGDGDSAFSINPAHQYQDAGIYNVSLLATTEFGCKTDSVFYHYIEVFENPTAAFTYNPDPAEVLSPVIYFTNHSNGATDYEWNLGDGATSTESDPIHQYNAIQTFPVQLIAISNEGCRDTARGEVIINPSYTLYVPNSFTPNGDGKNDQFNCQGIGITAFRMSIFNRWGSPICTINNLGDGWNGSYNGKEAPEDTYVYLIEATDVFDKKHTLAGRVTIIK